MKKSTIFDFNLKEMDIEIIQTPIKNITKIPIDSHLRVFIIF